MNRQPSDLDWLWAFSLVSILQQEKWDFQWLGSSPVPARAELCSQRSLGDPCPSRAWGAGHHEPPAAALFRVLLRVLWGRDQVYFSLPGNVRELKPCPACWGLQVSELLDKHASLSLGSAGLIHIERAGLCFPALPLPSQLSAFHSTRPLLWPYWEIKVAVLGGRKCRQGTQTSSELRFFFQAPKGGKPEIDLDVWVVVASLNTPTRKRKQRDFSLSSTYSY